MSLSLSAEFHPCHPASVMKADPWEAAQRLPFFSGKCPGVPPCNLSVTVSVPTPILHNCQRVTARTRFIPKNPCTYLQGWVAHLSTPVRSRRLPLSGLSKQPSLSREVSAYPGSTLGSPTSPLSSSSQCSLSTRTRFSHNHISHSPGSPTESESLSYSFSQQTVQDSGLLASSGPLSGLRCYGEFVLGGSSYVGWIGTSAIGCQVCGTSRSLSVSLQDEMEIGYIQAPHKTLPVVFDSPRDRGLKDFPVKRVMVGTLEAWQTPSHPAPLALTPRSFSTHLPLSHPFTLVLKAEVRLQQDPRGGADSLRYYSDKIWFLKASPRMSSLVLEIALSMRGILGYLRVLLPQGRSSISGAWFNPLGAALGLWLRVQDQPDFISHSQHIRDLEVTYC